MVCPLVQHALAWDTGSSCRCQKFIWSHQIDIVLVFMRRGDDESYQSLEHIHTNVSSMDCEDRYNRLPAAEKPAPSPSTTGVKNARLMQTEIASWRANVGSPTRDATGLTRTSSDASLHRWASSLPPEHVSSPSSALSPNPMGMGAGGVKGSGRVHQGCGHGHLWTSSWAVGGTIRRGEEHQMPMRLGSLRWRQGQATFYAFVGKWASLLSFATV
jgi:hypothetical protein